MLAIILLWGLDDIEKNKNKYSVSRCLTSIVMSFRKYKYQYDEVKAGFLIPYMRDCDIGLRGAAGGGHHKFLEYYIDQGAIDFTGALQAAARSGQLKTVQYILDRYYKFHAKDIHLPRVLYAAVAGGYLDIVKYINEKMNNLWLNRSFITTKAIGLAIWHKQEHVKPYLETFLYEPDVLVSAAVGTNNLDLAEHYINQANTNNIPMDKLLEQGLQGAVRGGHLHLMEHFVKRGAQINESILSEAIENEHKHIYEMIIEKYPNIISKSNVMAAIEIGNIELVKFLLSCTEIIDNDYQIYLETAVSHNQQDLIKYFVNECPYEYNYKYILHFVSDFYDKEIVKFLISLGATYKYNVCVSAIQAGDIDFLKYLTNDDKHNFDTIFMENYLYKYLDIVYYIIDTKQCGYIAIKHAIKCHQYRVAKEILDCITFDDNTYLYLMKVLKNKGSIVQYVESKLSILTRIKYKLGWTQESIKKFLA